MVLIPFCALSGYAVLDSIEIMLHPIRGSSQEVQVKITQFQQKT